MAIYSMIDRWVRDHEGFATQPSWIAHVKADFGLTRRAAPNRRDNLRRVKPCPPDKRAGIVRALRNFGMV